MWEISATDESTGKTEQLLACVVGGTFEGELGQGCAPYCFPLCLPIHSFGICLVPRTSEDKFDCYKCHWREGSMDGYGICE